MKKITKWCIRRNENYYEPINKWFAEQTGRAYSTKSDFHKKFGDVPSYWTYLHYPMVDNRTLHKGIMDGYTEITREEFEKFILNTNVTKTRLLKHWVNPNQENKLEVIRK
jgi:hypothetical protein